MGFTNASLGYLNFPTQVIFKSCKLIPVLLGGIVIQGKKYGILDFAAALLMCVGLAVFTLADSQVLVNIPKYKKFTVYSIHSVQTPRYRSFLIPPES